jgi:PST family polysaccharide transporter
MKSIFRATAILSGGSVAAVLFRLVSAKVLASVLQPAGYGLYALLQSFVGLTSLVAGLGIAAGLVRQGASALAHDDELTISSLRRAAWILFCGLGTMALLVLVVLSRFLSRWALGSPDHSVMILLMGTALLFTVAGQIQSGTLNAYHRVAALAKCSVATGALAGGLSITCVLIWRLQGIVPAVIGGALAGWLVSGYLLRREVGPTRVHAERRDVQAMVWSLLRFGGPYTASVLVGTGVQVALPMIILHLLGTESVGYYRAAVAVSVGYLGFLTTAMGQDYYPRVAAVKDQARALVQLINEQQRLVMLLAVPMTLGALALAPCLVPILYSHKFVPTVEILEWQLIGDLFKFSSMTMSWVILARCRSRVYFLVESIGGLASLATLWPAVRWLGLPGLGVSFLARYVIYFAVVWLIMRREISVVWTAENKIMMITSLAAALAVRILPSTSFANLRTPVALLLAFAAGGWGFLNIWRELWGRGATSAA